MKISTALLCHLSFFVLVKIFVTFVFVSPSEPQVSANCADTIAFVEGLAPDDPLIKGVPDDKNPYKGDKGGCIIT